MTLGDQFENPTVGTIKMLKIPKASETIEAVERLGQLLRDGTAIERKGELASDSSESDLLGVFLRKVSYRDLKIATLCAKMSWNYSYTELGKAMGCSKQAAHKAYVRMCDNIEKIYKESVNGCVSRKTS